MQGSTKKVRKAVIPVAGLGTRFLPATKTIPKEMLPIVDRPIILHIVEEAAQAGIEDVVLIAGRNKTAIEDFFDISYELEDKLHADGRSQMIEDLQRIQSLTNVISVRQHRPLGLGHAVLCGRSIVGEEPFAVLLGDEIMISGAGQPTAIGALIGTFESTGLSTVAMMQVAATEAGKYGIVEGEIDASGLTKGLMRVRNVIEKPTAGQSQSRWALPGRYVFDGEIFKYLECLKPGRNGEIQLSDAMAQLAKEPGLLAAELKSRRYDAGDKLGFLMANIELALDRPELGPQLRQYLKTLASGL